MAARPGTPTDPRSGPGRIRLNALKSPVGRPGAFETALPRRISGPTPLPVSGTGLVG